MNRQIPILLGLGAISVATFIAVKKYFKSHDAPPKEWKKVGILSDLMCFPIKSCGVVRATEMECTRMGLQIGILRDRFFMIVDSKNEFVTARNYPKLVLIHPKVIDDKIVLEAPGMDLLEIDLNKLNQDKLCDSLLWDGFITSVDCGEAAAKWFSQYILNQSDGIRLVCYPKSDENKERVKKNGIAFNHDTGAFPDLSSYNIINASSVDDLNTRLSEPVTPQNFRPNFVVEGATAYDEDNWYWVKIGDTVFKAIKNCTRCILTAVNPETGERNKRNEPLPTLKKYRIIQDNKQNIQQNKVHPVMGIHLALNKGGPVKIGDAVYVG